LRFASYERNGEPSFGIVKGEGLIDIPKREPALADLAALLRSGRMDMAAALAGEEPDIAFADITFLPVIPHPDKLIGVGLNYRDHAAEIGADIPERPTLFIRFADAQVGHLQPLVAPKASRRFDYEAELAVIIGKAGRHIARNEAFGHIAGYSCFNDGSIRDWQGHSSQYTAGKNFIATGALGPWLVTADEIPDPGRLAVTAKVNGDFVQSGTTADMVFDVPALIEYISTFTVLRPGDVIATGTPAGVGYRRNPRLYMKAGDVVEVEVEGVGLLRNPVVDEA